MSNAVMGQTGRTVLSADMINYKLSQKRTVRYWLIRCAQGYRAEVVGPFHSVLYAVCSFGTTRQSAKAALERRLANEYGYIGTMLYSDVDTSDTVGYVNPRLLDDNATARPITRNELVGCAGR